MGAMRYRSQLHARMPAGLGERALEAAKRITKPFTRKASSPVQELHPFTAALLAMLRVYGPIETGEPALR